MSCCFERGGGCGSKSVVGVSMDALVEERGMGWNVVEEREGWWVGMGKGKRDE